MLSGLGLRIRLEIGGVRGPMQGPARLGPESGWWLIIIAKKQAQEGNMSSTMLFAIHP